MKEYTIELSDNENALSILVKAYNLHELIRCKDCKYNDDGECIIKAGWFPVKPDWFCADGERSQATIK